MTSGSATTSAESSLAATTMTAATTATAGSTMRAASQLAFLSRALRAPAIRDSFERLADAAREQGWSHEEYLAAVLGREVAAREAHGAAARIRRAGFPAVKTLEEFDFAHAPDLNRELVVHLGMADFVAAKSNVVLLGPPGTGKTHLAIALAVRAAQVGHKVAFATASHWVMRLSRAHNTHGLTPNCAAWPGSRCWFSTRSATSPWTPAPRT